MKNKYKLIDGGSYLIPESKIPEVIPEGFHDSLAKIRSNIQSLLVQFEAPLPAISQALSLANEQTQKFADLARNLALSMQVTTIFPQLDELAKKTAISFDMISGVSARASILPENFHVSLTNSTKLISLTECFVDTVSEWQNIGAKLGNEIPRVFQEFQTQQLEDINALNDIVASIIPDLSKHIAPINELSFLDVSTREVFAHSYAISGLMPTATKGYIRIPDRGKELFEKLSDEATGEIVVLLGNVNTELVSMWHGVKDAALNQHHDHKRHIGISLRELLTELIHKLAPDKLVQAWSNSPVHFGENGRPTRNARLEFILREIDDCKLAKFLALDIKAALELFQVVNGMTHSRASSLSGEGVRAVIFRAEQLIIYLIKVSRKLYDA